MNADASPAVPSRLAGPLTTIAVAISPVVAYGLALCQELGFYSVLNIPLSLMRVDLYHLLPILLVLASAAAIVFAWVSFAWTTFKKYSRLLGTLVPETAYVLILVLLFPGRPKEWVWSAALFAWMELAYLLPALGRNKGRSFAERYDENAIKAGAPTLWQSPSLSRLGFRLIMAAVAVFALGYLCFSYGRHEAFYNVDYLTINDTPEEAVVLRTYGNFFALTGTIDDATKTLTGQFAFVSLVGPPSHTMKVSHTGPLRPVPARLVRPTSGDATRGPELLPGSTADTSPLDTTKRDSSLRPVGESIESLSR